MKRTICIIAIFLFLISLGVIDLLVVNKTFNNMSKKVSALKQDIYQEESLESIAQTAKEIESYWIKNEKKLTIFLYYRDIDVLGKQVDLVCALLKNDDVENAKTEILQLEYLLKSASKVYKFNFDNLL